MCSLNTFELSGLWEVVLFTIDLIQCIHFKISLFEHFRCFSREQYNGGLLDRTTHHKLWYKDAPVTTKTNASAAPSPEHPPRPDIRTGTPCSGSGTVLIEEKYNKWLLMDSLLDSVLFTALVFWYHLCLYFTAYPRSSSPSAHSRGVRQRSKSSINGDYHRIYSHYVIYTDVSVKHCLLCFCVYIQHFLPSVPLQQHFFDDDDRMVPSTPTLVVPHRSDGFDQAIQYVPHTCTQTRKSGNQNKPLVMQHKIRYYWSNRVF